MSAEHRRSERHRVRFRLAYDDGSSYSVGFVEDISATGMLLEAPGALAVGTVLRLEPFEQHEDALFELQARVVRCVKMEPLVAPPDPEPSAPGMVGLGLEFLELDQAAKQALERMIEQMERQRAVELPPDPFLGRH